MVRRTQGGRRPDDIPGEFAVVAIQGTHRDRTKRKHGAAAGHGPRNRLGKADKQKLLLEARRSGHSWREAAKIAGYRSVSGAYEAAQEAIADIPREAADEARAIELQRIDAVVRANWRNMQAGDPEASNVILRAIDRRARMLGLDLAEPEQRAVLDVRVQALLIELIGQPQEEFALHEAEIERLIDASQRGADRQNSAERTAASG